MIERNRGIIINVSSLAAWFQSTCNVQYGSTKSYLAVFSSSLHQELRGTNVRVQALCPGFVRTEFHGAESMKGFNQRCAPASRFWMSPDEVVDCSFRSLSGKRVIVIPGFLYRVLGRLAQMPVLQPLMQWITWGPRLPQRAEAIVEPCPTPAFAVSENTESAAA
jgi:short-subunit dehydrogenase